MTESEGSIRDEVEGSQAAAVGEASTQYNVFIRSGSVPPRVVGDYHTGVVDVGDEDVVVDLDEVDYAEVREAVGRGAPTLLLGTSTRSLERSLMRLRDAERGESAPLAQSLAGRRDPARAARLLVDAERVADSITDDRLRVSALSGVAKALAATDPIRAAQLFARAEQVAYVISDRSTQGWALSEVASALAATDPDRAERITRSISDQSAQASALSSIAEALSATPSA
jgi:hypothetical protein